MTAAHCMADFTQALLDDVTVYLGLINRCKETFTEADYYDKQKVQAFTVNPKFKGTQSRDAGRHSQIKL